MSDATLETALRSLYTAMLAHDIAALERLLTEDSVYIHSTGLAETRGEFSNGVRDGLYEYQRVRPVSEIVRRSGDLAAVFTVLDFIGGKHGLTHEPVTLLTTLIWERRDGAWRMSQRQATRVPRSWCQNEQPDPTALEPSYAAAG